MRTASVKRLSFGTYGLAVRRDGFATFSGRFDIRSVVPIDLLVELALAPIRSEVTVGAAETLLDPQQTAAMQRIGVDGDRARAAPQRHRASAGRLLNSIGQF